MRHEVDEMRREGRKEVMDYVSLLCMFGEFL